MVRFMQQVLTLFGVVVLSAAFAHAQKEPDGAQLRIREIRTDVATVYSDEQATNSNWAAYINRFHIPTRESVIRTQLLFKEGDALDKELLESSERSLRRFKFLNQAEVVVVPVDEHTVDVEVRTKDAWSLEPGLNIKGGGDLYTISAHLIEFNLLGYGKKLFVEAAHETDVGTTTKYGYSDYQLFNTRWVGIARYTTGPLIESYFVSATRPLYSPDSEWSYGGSAYQADEIIRLFEDGEESSRFSEDQTKLAGFVKRSFGPRYKKTNLKFDLTYLKADYSTLGSETTTPPPPDQANVTPTVGITIEDIDWTKQTYINKMGITEDARLGLRYGGKAGYGIPVEDGFELWELLAFASYKKSLARQQFLSLGAGVGSEVVRNTIVLGKARYYKKFSSHTVATRFKAQLGYELDSSKQFTLGADSGLRGYPARKFSGEKLVLMNLEDRQFWGSVSIGPKLAIGTVLFLDAGNVWKDEEEVDLTDLNWSTGFGFRIGFSHLPHQPIFRCDFGWAIGGEDSFAVTLGMEQQF